MAYVSATYSLDLTDLDLSRIVDGFIWSRVYDDGPYSVLDETYDNLVGIGWFYRMEEDVSWFWGDDLTLDNGGLSGEVSVYVENYWNDVTETLEFYWGIYDIGLEGAEVYAAALTDSTEDDAALVEEALSGDDVFELSAYNDAVNGYAGADAIRGYGGNDRLWGGNGRDTLLGGTGDDFIFGNRHADILKGQRGSDDLRGGLGGDMLWGGLGKDRMTGGADEDFFRFGRDDGLDIVIDFADDVDTLVLETCLWDGDLTRREVVRAFATVTDGDVVFDFGDGDRLTVLGIDDRSLLFNDVLLLGEGDTVA